MSLNRSEPPALPKSGPWRVEIEPTDIPMGRWRIRLVKGCIVIGGSDGWGWTTYTLAGAQRKGARELARKVRKDASMERRRGLVA